MVKRLQIPVRGLGSEVNNPSVSDLAAWAKTRAGIGGDVTTFYLMKTIEVQKSIDLPAAGGWYYRKRMVEGIIPDAPIEDILDDIRAVSSFVRNCWWSLPSACSADEDEVMAFRQLLRTMRDEGVYGHVILSDTEPTAIERELITGRRVFWYLTEPTEKSLEKILEIQRDIAVPPVMIPILDDLMGSYTVRKVIVMNPDEKDLRRAMDLVDTDNLMTGGFAPAGDGSYWEDLVSGSFILR